MKQFDFSKFSHQELEKLGQALLNKALKIELVPVTGAKDNNPPDLWLPYPNGRIRAIAEIKGFQLNPKEVIQLNSTINNWIVGYRPEIFYLLVFSELDSTLKGVLDLNLSQNSSNLIYNIFDINWVIQQLTEFPEFIEKWEADNLEPKTSNPTEEEKNNKDDVDLLADFIETANITVYALGASWSGVGDQSERFLENSIWENGDDKSANHVKKVIKDDIVVLKSAYAIKRVGHFRVKAIGKVIKNHNDGRKLDIKWIYIPENVKIPGALSSHRSRISSLNKEELKEILIALEIKDIWSLALNVKTDQEDSNSKQSDFLNQNFWWLRNNDLDWSFKNLSPTATHSYAVTNSRIETINENENFLNVKKGDLLLAFQKNDENSVLLILEAENEIDLIENSIFKYKISQKLESPINIESILALDSIKNSEVALKPKSNLLALSKSQFNDIVASKDNEGLIGNIIKSPTFNNDGAKGQDLLEFEKDVKSFASLISFKDIKPPIAIALFGKWGSGKSFFMNKLETEIKIFSKKDEGSQEGSYVKGIAHINFNAWSYMDSNLWAGFAQSLFEKLNEYITDNTKGDLERLTVELTIAKRLAFLNNQFDHYSSKKKQIVKLKTKFESERNNKILNYISPQYDNTFLTFLSKIGIKETDAKELLPSQLKPAIKQGFRFFKYLKYNIDWIIGSVVGIGLLLVLMKEPISNLLENISPFWDWVISFWGKITTSISLPPIAIWVIYKIKKWLTFNKITAFTTLIDDINVVNESEDSQKARLKKDLIELNEQIERTSFEIQSIETKDYDINDLAINNFIASKVNHEDYKKHQGIITTIRKDFEMLSDLFVPRKIDISLLNEKETDRVNNLANDREKIDKQFKGEEYRKLERIVLYIDDLDRCSDEKVIEVLEAVNLLMAFPLFIVVVGVDPKWVNNALTKKYHLHFKNEFDNGENNSNNELKLPKIKVSDYLEKIFQIPFHLKKPTNQDAKNMLEHIFENEIEKKTIKNEIEKKTIKYSRKRAEEVINMSDEDEFRADYEQYKEEERIKAESKEFQELKLSIEEFDCLKQMIWLIDNTPRSIKRFTNIYRIVRSHENLTYYESSKNRDFLMVMFILGLNIGTYKKCASILFNTISNNPEKSLKKIFDISTEKEIKIIYNEIEKIEMIHQLLEIKGKEFVNHIPFVKRFSFKNIED